MHARKGKQQARRLFMEVVELPDAERSAALDRACGKDDGLRAEVEALLRADRAAGPFLSSPTGPRDLPKPPDADGAANGPASALVAERAGAQIDR
jgi:hypothetical protein